MEEVQITGHVTNIIYQNPTNGYTVLILENENGELTVTGSSPGVQVGDKLKVTGFYEEHVSYGLQLKMRSFERAELEGLSDIEIYLSSGAIKGVGEKLAAKIIAKFGEDTLRIMEEEPERLKEISGISLRKAQDIGVQVYEKRNVRRIMTFLAGLGVTGKLAVKIYEKYGDDVSDVIGKNPYRLAEDIDGIGFKRADEIAERLGVLVNSEFRIKSGIMYALSESLQEGNTCLPEEELIEKSAVILGIDEENVRLKLADLMMDHKLILKNENGRMFAYSAVAYKCESACAAKLLRLSRSFDGYDGNVKNVDIVISNTEKSMGIKLEEIQKNAVLMAVKNGVTIITGGPGTGKTTAIRAMLRVFEERGKRVFLAAPTGRAAKRMSEMCGKEASTIHRLLGTGVSFDGSGTVYSKNEDEPIEADVVIIDETSMVDIFLFNALLSALSEGTSLVLIGDCDQLPSVGPGNVFKDLIDSGEVPTIRFDRVFRQEEDSDILTNAHRIKEGKDITIDNQKSRDFYFVPRDEEKRLKKDIIYLVKSSLPDHLKISSGDVQVLTPMRKGNFGSVAINAFLQEMLNPPAKGKKEWEYGDIIFRVGDKVMQIKNDYDLEWEIRGNYGLVAEKGQGVFNGDIGRITEINEYAGYLTVMFEDSKIVSYKHEQLEELEPAYAITIHKSQGSEYEAVVMPLFNVSPNLRYRNLLYTGVTRAKRCVTILGSMDILNAMIRCEDQNVRYSGLKNRIKEAFSAYGE